MPRILCVDDKTDNLIALSALLRALIPGCEVLTAQSGPEGLEKATTQLPDTILLDIKMPGMDGYEVCKRLKINEKTRSIPVIMITAIKTESEDFIKGLEIGADAYLAKPIDEYVLVAQVNAALRIKKAEDELRHQKNLLEEAVQKRTTELLKTNAQLQQEIEERKRAEVALRESEENYRLHFENVSEVIYSIDSGRRVVNASPSIESTLGYRPDELIGRSFETLGILAEEYMLAARSDIKRVLAGERIASAVYEFIARDGSRKTGEVSNNPLIKNDQIVGVISVARDITEKQRMEAQLLQAQKMEAIGTLAGGIAHDFNNMLGIIMINAELAMDEIPEWHSAHVSLSQINAACHRAKDVVRQLLSFSRNMEQQRKPIKINSVVKESTKLLRASIPTSIDIRSDIPEDVGTIKADPTQIHQILINLCMNAAHAMEENGGILDIRLKQVQLDSNATGQFEGLRPGAYLELTVSDTGHGIAPEIKNRIFDPYFTTKGIGKGSGMGLAVVHGIVKNHEGAISVESQPGKGSTFRVLFPVVAEQPRSAGRASAGLPMGKERILFVDDEEILVEAVPKALQRLGYQVSAVSDPVKALELFRSDPRQFDLIITDMTMPQMTGDRLVKEILKVRSDIPIILCTGFSNKIDKKTAKSIGAHQYIEKPFDQQKLAITVRQVLDRKKG